MQPKYFQLDINGKKLVVFYPQFKTKDGWRIISKDNPYPVELTDGEAYAFLLESISQKEEETKSQLEALAELVNEMKLLSTGPPGEQGEAFVYDDFTEEQLEGLTGPRGQRGLQGEKGDPGEVTQEELSSTATLLSQALSNHTDDKDIHVTTSDKERWDESGIAEQGETDDGHYIRYEDGTQVCWGEPFQQNTEESTGEIYRSDSESWEFPKPFDESYPIFVSASVPNSTRWADISGAGSGESQPIRQFSSVSSSTLIPTRVFAYGRWK